MSEEMTWRPIETAPKDGTEILVCGGTFSDDCDWSDTAYPYSGYAIVQWDGQDNGHPWEGHPCHDGDGYRNHAPTHWMPLPAPPALATASKEGGE